MKRKPKPAPDDTRTVALTRVETDAILDALRHAAISAAINGETCYVETAVGNKLAALWPAPKRRRPI